MTRFMLVLLAAASLLATGCEPSSDASSEGAAEESLSEDKRREFQEAVLTVALADADLLRAGLRDRDALFDAAKAKLEGKTVDEIIALAEPVEAQREKPRAVPEAKPRIERLGEPQKKRAGRPTVSILDEPDIDRLEEPESKSGRHKSTEPANPQLEQFEIDRAAFHMRSGRHGRAKPLIELEVTNNTDHAVSHAYFNATYTTPSRSVPWFEQGFSHAISGGLEPGESASWNLVAGFSGDWDSLEPRDDAVLTVEETKLEGADGEALFEEPLGEDGILSPTWDDPVPELKAE